MDKKHSNGYGIVSLISFLVGIFVIAYFMFETNIQVTAYSLLAVLILGISLIASFVFALANVTNFYSKKSINKCNKFYLIFDWIIVLIAGFYLVLYPIYTIIASFIAL